MSTRVARWSVPAVLGALSLVSLVLLLMYGLGDTTPGEQHAARANVRELFVYAPLTALAIWFARQESSRTRRLALLLCILPVAGSVLYAALGG